MESDKIKGPVLALFFNKEVLIQLYAILEPFGYNNHLEVRKVIREFQR